MEVHIVMFVSNYGDGASASVSEVFSEYEKALNYVREHTTNEQFDPEDGATWHSGDYAWFDIETKTVL